MLIAKTQFYQQPRGWVVMAFRLITTCAVALAFLVSAAAAQTLNSLYEFQGNADGGGPNDLIRDSSGNLYGTTVGGGTTIFGTVFKIDPSGKKTILYNFLGGTDGTEPHGSLAMDAQGNLYGTTEYGGDLSVLCAGMQGCGVVFMVDSTGHETVLYRFTGGADGAQPLAGLLLDSAGNLYGTTAGGGLSGCNYWAVGCGVVFKLDPNANETVLYSFSGGVDGGVPASPVIQDPTGNLYGMTTGVGAGSNGTVFKLDSNGNETVLHAFKGLPDGSQPYGTLVRDAMGNLYGATYGGGIFDPTACNSNGCGTVFRVSTASKEKVLFSFAGSASGWGPMAGLIRDKHGNLYGTAALGGSGSLCCGLVFELDPKGNESILHTFTGAADGGSPEAGLVPDNVGHLYGTALQGTYGYGVAFEVTLPTFTLSTLPTVVTISPGGQATSKITVSPIALFKGTVALSCTVPSGKGLSCSVNPNSVSLDGTNAISATLSISSSSTTPAGSYTVGTKGTSGFLQSHARVIAKVH